MPNTIHPPKMPDGDDTWIAKGMPPKTNEGWIEEFNEFFKGNIAKDSTLRCNTKYVKDFIRTLLTEKDKQREEAVAEAKKGERERFFKRVHAMSWEQENETKDAIRLLKELYDFLTPHPRTFTSNKD